MPRILAVSTRYPDRVRPGLGIFVERQLQELARRDDFEIDVVAPVGLRPFPLSMRDPSRPPLDALPDEEVRRGLRVHRPRFPVLPRIHVAAWTLPWALVRLGRNLHAERPFDAISAEFSWPEGPAAVALARVIDRPVSIKARGLDFELGASHALRRSRLLAAAHAATGLLAVSEDVKTRMTGLGLPAERILVHHPAVDSQRFDIGCRKAAKAALGLSGPVLLTVGNLIPVKQQRLAIEALVRLPDATLLIVGGGPERAALGRLAQALGLSDRVRLMGSVYNELLPTIYNAADVMVHCPSVEGFANVRLEALACGTPLVTTAVGDARHIVSNPAAGRIVPADADAIAAAAAVLIATPPERAATRQAAAKFTWSRATDEIAAYFTRLAAGRSRRVRGAC